MALSLTRLVAKKPVTSSPYDRVIQACLWLIVFLTPFFFLPFTTDPLEFNKALLMYVLVLVAGIVWLLKLVVKREGTAQRTPFDLPLVLFLLFSVLATIFSLYRYHSLVGTGGYVSGSLVATVFFLFFFYLVVNTVKREQLGRLFLAVLLSGALIVLFNFFQVFGLHILPWSFAQAVAFNGVASSPATFSIYVAIITFLAMYRFLATYHGAKRRPLERGLTLLLSILGFFLLVVYDQPIGWFALILGFLVYLVFLTAAHRNYPTVVLILPTVALGLSLIALFVNTQALLQANIPGDVRLPARFGWGIALDSVKSSPFVGFGQETYEAVFARFRPTAFNDTGLWSLRFVKSSNEWFQLVSATGVLGALALFLVAMLFLWRIVRGMLKTAGDDPWWWWRLAATSTGLLLVLLMFFMPFNFVLSFLFWLTLAIGTILFREKEPTVNGRTAKMGTSLASSLGFSLAVVLGVILLYFAGRIWIADVKVAQANAAIAAERDLEEVRRLFTVAIDLNPYEQTSYFNLAQNLLVQAQLGSQKETPDLNQLRVLIAASVAAAQRGASRYDRFSGSYETLSRLYQDTDALTGASSDETKNAFTKAVELEPNNPQLHFNLGNFFLFLARQKTTQAAAQDPEKPDEQLTQEAQSALDEAKKAFEEAGRLKKNYTAAQLNIALVLRLQSKGDEAVKMLEEMAAADSFNTDVLFNLGENYLIDNRRDEAEAAFLRILDIFPGHSDARFRLAQVYEERGEKERAIAEYEIVAKNNPENEEVKKKLAELKGS